MRIEFQQRKSKGPANLVADAEVYFDADGMFHGMKLVGFTLWRGDNGVFCTFPSRQYEGKEGKAYYDFLRSADSGAEGKKAMYAVKDAIVAAWQRESGEVSDSDDAPF